MKITKFILLALVFATAITVSSCKKESSTEDTDVSGASDNSLAENTSNDIVSIASQAADNNGTSGTLSTYKYSQPGDELYATCASSVVRDTTAHTVTVTFNGATCTDGRTRSGSLVINYSASTNNAVHYRDPGFSCTVTSNNYVVNGNQVNIISKTITNTTALPFDSSTTNETWSISANINIIKSNGGTISWTCNRVKTLLNTSTTYLGHNNRINWSIARIGITGSASGTRSNGETFTVNVTSQLIRDFGICNKEFIGGTLDFTPGTKPTRHFDYGDGVTCDGVATVTINGIVHNINLP